MFVTKTSFQKQLSKNDINDNIEIEIFLQFFTKRNFSAIKNVFIARTE